MVRLAASGLPVVFRRPPLPPGKRPRGDYHAMLGALQALPNVTRLLDGAGLTPLVTGDDVPPYWARRTAESLYLFFAHPTARDLRYPMSHGQSLCTRRETRRITIDFEGQSPAIDLVFEPYQSLLIRANGASGVQFVGVDYRPPDPVIG